MIEIRLVNTEDKKQVKEFVQFQFDLYKNCGNWVPPFRDDILTMLNKKKHPFYEHSEGDFFTAWIDGKMVGRTAVLENKLYNDCHQKKCASLFLFDSIDDQNVANALFDKAVAWAKERGLDSLIGTKGFSLFDGYGVLVEGFECRQMNNFSAYNYPYYQKLFENYGFSRINEYVSMTFNVKDFQIPEKVHKVTEIVKQKGYFSVKTYASKKELLKDARKIGELYVNSFKNNWEYYPITDREFDDFVNNVLTFVVPRMLKFIQNPEGEIVGFLVAFPDISAAMKRHNGNLTPALLLDLLYEMKHSKGCALNGFGILEQYHNRGGNALLYSAIEDLFKEFPQYLTCEAVQMADTAHEVRRDMETLGLVKNKAHRVYEIKIN